MFSRATITEVLNQIEGWNHSTITSFLCKYGLDCVAPENGESKQRRINKVVSYLDNNKKLRGIFSDNLHFEIIEEIIKDLVDRGHYDEFSETFNKSPNLHRLLKMDGYTIYDGELRKEISNELVDIKEKKNLLQELLDKHGFSISEGHFDQAINAYTRGDWASANAQIRSYVESLFQQMAENLYGTSFATSYESRVALSKQSPVIFDITLNEWDDNGTGFINGFWKRLHPQGSHPGLSDELDCKFRLDIVIITTYEMIRRYDLVHPI